MGLVLFGTCSCAVVRCVLCALSGPAAPGGRCCLTPVRVPWLWPAACPSGVPGGPAWCAAGRLVLFQSVRSRCWGWLSRRCGAFSYPSGLRPRLYWVAAWGTWRPAEIRARCACRWPPPRQGRWARSAAYMFGALRWGCPWRVPPASVLGCVRCSDLRAWSRSVTCPVSRTVPLPTGDSVGAPGLFRVDADTAPFWAKHATPGSRACVRVCAPLSRVGRAGLPGAFWCASPFPVAGTGALFVCSALSGLLGALLVVVVGCFCFFFLFLVSPRCLRRSFFSGPGCLGPWRLVVLPPAPPLFGIRFPPPCLRFSAVPGPGCFGPWRSVVPSLGSPLGFFFSGSLTPPLFFSFFFAVPQLFLGFLFFFPSSAPAFFFLSAFSCWFCGARAGLCVLGCGVCWCV